MRTGCAIGIRKSIWLCPVNGVLGWSATLVQNGWIIGDYLAQIILDFLLFCLPLQGMKT